MAKYIKAFRIFIVKGVLGQDLAEYGLLVGFVAFVILIGVQLFGQQLLEFFNDITTQLDAVLPP